MNNRQMLIQGQEVQPPPSCSSRSAAGRRRSPAPWLAAAAGQLLQLKRKKITGKNPPVTNIHPKPAAGEEESMVIAERGGVTGRWNQEGRQMTKSGLRLQRTQGGRQSAPLAKGMEG